MNGQAHRAARFFVLLLLTFTLLATPAPIAASAEEDEPEFSYPENAGMTLDLTESGELIGTAQNSVFAVDPATGAVAWRYVNDTSFIELQVIKDALHAFWLDESTGDLVDLDPENGIERWRYGGLPADELWALYVTAANDEFVVMNVWGEFGSMLVGLAAETGTVAWVQSFMNSSTPAGDVIAIMSRPGPSVDGLLTAAGVWTNYSDQSGVLYSMDAGSGWPIWVFYPGQLAYIVEADDGLVFALVADGRDDASFVTLQAVSDDTGETVWSTDLPGPALHAKEAGRRIAVYTVDGSLLLLDGATGQAVWSATPERQIESIGLDDQRVYSSETGGILVARSAETGDVLWTRDDAEAGVVAGVEGGQDLLLVTSESTLTRLDSTTGTTLWIGDPLVAPGRQVPIAVPVSPAQSFSGASVDSIASLGPLASLTARALPWSTDGDTEATDINASGQISGVAEGEQHADHAMLWTDGVPLDLGALPGGRESGALALNDSGEVVGWSQINPDEQHAVRWISGVIEDIHPSDYVNSVAYDVNEAGQICGIGYDENGAPHALLWEQGAVIELPDLGGGFSAAFSINDGGFVAGTAADTSGQARAVVWHGETIEELNTPASADSIAEAINDGGDVVGFMFDSDNHRHAVLWTGGKMMQLAAPGGAAAQAISISDDGYAVGRIQAEIGTPRAVLWSLKNPNEFQVLGNIEGGAAAIGADLRIVGTWNETAVHWEPTSS